MDRPALVLNDKRQSGGGLEVGLCPGAPVIARYGLPAIGALMARLSAERIRAALRSV